MRLTFVEVVRYGPADFVRFVETPPLEGLGMTVASLRGIFHDDIAVLDMIDAAVQRKGGRPERAETLYDVQGFIPPAPTGNSQGALLRRLRKDHHDLHKMVLNGELSANAAAIEAGFRKRATASRRWWSVYVST